MDWIHLYVNMTLNGRTVGISSTGVRALTGGLETKVQVVASFAVWTHCMIHWQALVAKKIPRAWSHDKNTPVETFLQDAKYVAPCTFHDIFDVKCPLWVALKEYSFFPPEQMNLHMVCFMWHWFYTCCCSSDLKCVLSGAISLMLRDVLN